MSADLVPLKVVAAAIRGSDGEVHTLPPPARHFDIVWKMVGMGLETRNPQTEQGFLLSDGRFCARKPAKLIAEQAGQLLPRASDLSELFSEDVW